MNRKHFLARIFNYFNDKHSYPLTFDIYQDKELLDKLVNKYRYHINKDSPQSYYWRSFLQYKCCMSHVPLFNKIILYVISIIIFPIFIIIGVLNKIVRVHTQKIRLRTKMMALDLTRGYFNIFPSQIKDIKDRFEIIRPARKCFTIDKDLIKLILSLIIKAAYHPFFILKVSTNLSIYNYLILVYNPKAIINSKEFSFSSSILTAYLESKGILHINVMHGEKLFNIRDSFFRFSECWVWDSHYSNLFKKLWAYPNQFRIGQPDHHLALTKNNRGPQNITLKFYWGEESDYDELKYISTILTKFQNLSGAVIIIRYHPSHKEFFCKKVLPFFQQFLIENPLEVNIYESLASSTHVFGTYSTVLYEGKLNGKKVVINDYADIFQKLIKLDYILAKDPSVILLSKLVDLDFRRL